MHLGEQRRQSFVVIRPLWPVSLLPNIALIAGFHAVIMAVLHRTVKIITALTTSNNPQQPNDNAIALTW
jgi:hypothetical protein